MASQIAPCQDENEDTAKGEREDDQEMIHWRPCARSENLTATGWKVTVTAANPNIKGARQPISAVVLSFVKRTAPLASANAPSVILYAEIGGRNDRGHRFQLHARFAADHKRHASGF
jgi:hypothetical protein